MDLTVSHIPGHTCPNMATVAWEGYTDHSWKSLDVVVRVCEEHTELGPQHLEGLHPFRALQGDPGRHVECGSISDYRKPEPETPKAAPEPPTLTSKFHLRMTVAERELVESVKAAAERAGLAPSLNDVLRHLIWRSAYGVPLTEVDAREAIHKHWADCSVCDPAEMPRCLDGLWMQRNYSRVACVTHTT